MRFRNLLFIGVGIIAGFAAPALADLTYTQGSGTTIFDFVCFTTKHCSAHVPVNSAGTEIATSSNPFRTDPTGSTTQPVSASSLPLPSGAATSTNQASELTKLDTIIANTGAPLAAGSALVGGFKVFDSAGVNQATVKPVSTPAVSTDTAFVVDQRPGTNVTVGPYPSGATPYTATATGTTAATTATLAGAASVTTYICGFSIRANATAAATGNATVTGVITATLNFTQWTAPNASGLGITEMIFSPCVPASATNQSVAVVSAAPGTGGIVSVTAWGYKL